MKKSIIVLLAMVFLGGMAWAGEKEDLSAQYQKQTKILTALESVDAVKTYIEVFTERQVVIQRLQAIQAKEQEEAKAKEAPVKKGEKK
jgi:hypothetical protein